MKYLYETIPPREGDAVRHYELEQGAYDPPLTQHPVTHEPIQRVILGGWGAVKAKPTNPSSTDTHCGCGPQGCC